ncbi:hypothetical protein [Pasteurella multocida]|uniref:hypothetical protein n=1 Tax=Pasteurella multocida TaxID=747 RepID=UPI001F61EB57|nr:hypothetical protein [Pasteurella multocida]
METKLIAIIFWFIFLLIPANNQTTLYIKIIGLLSSCLIIILSADWSGFKEAVYSSLISLQEWILIKADGDQAKANGYFITFLFIAMQPIILGGFWLYKKTRTY